MRFTKSLCAPLTLAFLLSTSIAFIPNTAAFAQEPSPEQSQEASPVQAQEESWTGTVEQKDVQGVKTYVLSVGGQSIPLEPQSKAEGFSGKNVKVTGKMEGGKIVISSIEEA